MAHRLQELERPKEDADPKALACYGVLVRAAPPQADQMLLRFVAGPSGERRDRRVPGLVQ